VARSPIFSVGVTLVTEPGVPGAMVRAQAFLLMLFCAAACDPNRNDDAGDADASTGEVADEETDLAVLAACDENDLNTPPFMGPAFDPETGALLEPLPEGHIVATTAGWSRADEAARQLLGDHSNLVIVDLMTHEGLLGATFGESEGCGSARTLTIWRDEASLVKFAAGPVHVTAIREALDATRAWETTHWTGVAGAEAPTWDEARARLAAVRVSR